MNLRAASTPPCKNVIISLRITLHLTYELGHMGMLESHDVNEAVLNVRTRVESFAFVEDLRADQPGEAREQSQGQAHQGEV